MNIYYLLVSFLIFCAVFGQAQNKNEVLPKENSLPNDNEDFKRVKRPENDDDYPDHNIKLELKIHHKNKNKTDTKSVLELNIDGDEDFEVRKSGKTYHFNPWRAIKKVVDRHHHKNQDGHPWRIFHPQTWAIPEDEDSLDELFLGISIAVFTFVAVIVVVFCCVRCVRKKKKLSMAKLEAKPIREVNCKSPVFFVHPYDKTFMSIAQGRWNSI